MPLSAIDAVSPAFQRATRQLFQPFRLGFWARLVVVVLIAREFIGGGWGGARFPAPQGGGERRGLMLFLAESPWERLQPFLSLILAGLGIALVALLFWIYAGSVYRFILLDVVLSDRCDLGEGWRRWQRQGQSLFLWWIGSSMALLAILAALFGIPAYLAWRAGMLRDFDRHFGLLLGGGIGLFFLLLGLILLAALVDLCVRDFVVPVMALDDVGVLDGWRRLLPMLGAEKMAYTGYVLMKLVLTLGSAVLLGLVNLMALVALLIPMAVIGVVLFLAGRAAGLHWSPETVTAVALLGLVAFGAILYVIALVSAPAMVFFQAYALHFFGSRYAPLGARLAPPAPPAEPSPSPAQT